jgi:hypothetical protein
MPLDAKEGTGAGSRLSSFRSDCIWWKAGKRVAGWEARTRLLAEPLSPRGPQPVLQTLRTFIGGLNGSPEPRDGVRG